APASRSCWWSRMRGLRSSSPPMPTCSRSARLRSRVRRRISGPTIMCGGPISVDEAWTFRDLVAAGWSEADLQWERLSLRALSDLGEGREAEALEEIRDALYVARIHFDKGDPRLAASLTSQAAALAA